MVVEGLCVVDMLVEFPVPTLIVVTSTLLSTTGSSAAAAATTTFFPTTTFSPVPVALDSSLDVPPAPLSLSTTRLSLSRYLFRRQQKPPHGTYPGGQAHGDMGITGGGGAMAIGGGIGMGGGGIGGGGMAAGTE